MNNNALGAGIAVAGIWGSWAYVATHGIKQAADPHTMITLCWCTIVIAFFATFW